MRYAMFISLNPSIAAHSVPLRQVQEVPQQKTIHLV